MLGSGWVLRVRSITMKQHNGSCSKTCGHALDITTVKANPETQRQLDRDPRVVEYTELDAVEHGGDWFEVVYAYRRPVAAIPFIELAFAW